MDGHDLAHYVIAAGLAVGVAAGIGYKPTPVVVQHVDAAVAKPVPGAWPSLGQDKTIQIGEALKASGPATVTTFCANPRCTAFQADLDDALQVAGWDDLEESSVIVGEETGLLVGPDGPKAQMLVRALRDAGLPVTVVPINPGASRDVGVIIAKAP